MLFSDDTYRLSDEEFDSLFSGIEKVEIDNVMDTEVKQPVKRNSGKYHGQIEITPNKDLDKYPYIIQRTIEFLNDQGIKGVTYEYLAENYEAFKGQNSEIKLTNAIYRMITADVLTYQTLEDITKSLGYEINIRYEKVKDVEIIESVKSKKKYSGKISLSIDPKKEDFISDHIKSFVKSLNEIGNEGYTFETLINEYEKINGPKTEPKLINIFYRMLNKSVLSFNSQEEISGLLGFRPVIEFHKDKETIINSNKLILDDELTDLDNN